MDLLDEITVKGVTWTRDPAWGKMNSTYEDCTCAICLDNRFGKPIFMVHSNVHPGMNRYSCPDHFLAHVPQPQVQSRLTDAVRKQLMDEIGLVIAKF
jgi:hypothetical protein